MKNFVIALLIASASGLRIRALKNVGDTQTPSPDGPVNGVARNRHEAWEPPNPWIMRESWQPRDGKVAKPSVDIVDEPAAAKKAAALAQKEDIRGPSTDGPIAGVYQWPTPPPAPAPLPGPHPPAAGKSLAQTGQRDGDYDSHAVLEDALHKDRMNKLQSVAGPDVTDQIGSSVHLSSMEGGEPNPSRLRDNLVSAAPKSFTPDYSKTDGGLTSADYAEAASKDAAKAIHAKEEADAAHAAIVAAESKKLQEQKDAEDKQKLIDSEPKTLAGREAKEKKLKEMEAKEAAAKAEEKAAELDKTANSVESAN